jgi:hypothetical protein
MMQYKEKVRLWWTITLAVILKYTSYFAFCFYAVYLRRRFVFTRRVSLLSPHVSS